MHQAPTNLLSYRRFLSGSFMLVAFFVRCFAAEGSPPAAGPVVELPKFVVTDSRELPPIESWRYAQIQGFEILSNASDKATQGLLNDFEKFKLALSIVLPVPNRNQVPVSLILCGRGGKFDAFVPAGKDRADAGRASLFLRSREQTAIVIDLEASILNVLSTETDDPAAGVDSSRVVVDHNKQLYREYVRYLLTSGEQRLPAWFEEGMAQIVMAMKSDRKTIIFGEVENPNEITAAAAMTAQMNAAASAADADAAALPGAPVEDRDFNAALQHKALVPMSKFFAVTHDAPEAMNPLGNNTWAKQAYAFVHLCLYGKGGRYQKAFATFLARATKEPVTEAMFKEAFKIGYKDMQLELSSYIDFTVYSHQEINFKGEGLPLPPAVVLRDATLAEIGRIKGEALVLAGHQDTAHTEFIAPYIRGQNDPQLLASLGLSEHAGGQDDRARKFLEAAIAAKVVRPRAYLELARLRYAEGLAHPGGEGGKLSGDQTSAVLAPLLTAQTQPPPMFEIPELLAEAWVHSAVKPRREDVAVLIEAVRQFPARLRLLFQTAGLCAEAGENDKALQMVEFGLKIAPDAKTRAPFEEMKSRLSAAPGPASAR